VVEAATRRSKQLGDAFLETLSREPAMKMTPTSAETLEMASGTQEGGRGFLELVA
jgi:hypothetical protein